MRFAHLFIIPTLVVAACAVGGCTRDTSDYPDNTEQTRAQADNIRAEKQRRDEVIDRDLQQTRTTLAFEEGQVIKKATQERQRIALDRDERVQPLMARQAEVKATSERDCERLTESSESRLLILNGEEAVRVTTETESRIAEVKRKAAEVTANTQADIAKANQDAADRTAVVDANEAKERAAIAARRDAAERAAREEHLAVAQQTSARIDQLGRQSRSRTEREREVEVIDHRRDEDISTAIRKDIARHGDPTRGVTVATAGGVVMLSGKVPNDTVRRTIVQDAGKISGVVRVDDRLAIH